MAHFQWFSLMLAGVACSPVLHVGENRTEAGSGGASGTLGSVSSRGGGENSVTFATTSTTGGTPSSQASSTSGGTDVTQGGSVATSQGGSVATGSSTGGRPTSSVGGLGGSSGTNVGTLGMAGAGGCGDALGTPCPSAIDAPTVSPAPAAQTCNRSIDVTLATSTPDATVYYRTDGGVPDCKPTGFQYSSPFSLTVNGDKSVTAIACKAGQPDSAVTRVTYSCGTWKNLGDVVIGDADCVTLAGQGGKLYAAFYENHDKVSVKTHAGGTWNYLGEPNFSQGAEEGFHCSLRIAVGQQRAYVAYVDLESPSGAPGAPGNNRLTVMRHNGVTDCSSNCWGVVGARRFNQGTFPIDATFAYSIQLEIDGDVPYLAFRDPAYTHRMTVMRYLPDVGWQALGVEGAIPAYHDEGYEGGIAMVLDQGIPYVAYQLPNASGTGSMGVAVKRYQDGAWTSLTSDESGLVESVGLPYPNPPALAVDHGQIYVAYARDFQDQLKTLRDGRWENAGPGFAPSYGLNNLYVRDSVIHFDYGGDDNHVLRWLPGDTIWQELGGDTRALIDGGFLWSHMFLLYQGTPYVIADSAYSSDVRVRVFD